MRSVSVLGATGSIGESAFDLLMRAGGPDTFRTVALTGAANVARLAEMARALRAQIAVTAFPEKLSELRAALDGSGVHAAAGPDAIAEAAARPADWTLSAIIGAAGLPPGLEVLKRGGTLALANKESLVAAGRLVMGMAARNGATILPVDSEHSAIFQSLQGESLEYVEAVTITASGGAFRDWPLERLARATVAEASSHPNWDMGQRITIDSASMFNKALEVIETHEFFGIDVDRIKVLVHPQSIIHAMVSHRDGGSIAHLGAPDMRHAIGYALNWPQRLPLPVPALDLAALGSLTFAVPDEIRWPALRLAREVIVAGGAAGAVLNAAKEQALDDFIAGRIGFMDMAPAVERALEHASREAGFAQSPADLATVTEWDGLARRLAASKAGGGMIADIGGLLWTVGAFVLALSIIVTVHEYGHYIIGRLSGIKAEVFSLGFGPRLLTHRDRHGTVWQLAALPLGGYVRFLGDANAASAGSGAEVDPALARQSLPGAPLWARFATVAAGPVFNFILSILVFAGMAMWQGMPADEPAVGALQPVPPSIQMGLQPGDRILAIDGRPVASWADLGDLAGKLTARPSHDWTVGRDGQQITVPGPGPMPALITGVAPRSAAASAGLRAGDVILAIEGQPVTRFDELREHVAKTQGRPIVLRVWREGQADADYTLAPREQDLPTATGYEKRWMIGVTGGGTFFEPATRGVGIPEALGVGAARTWDIIASSVSGLWAMVTGQIGTCNLGGAISIAESTGQAASAGGGNFIWWIAVLSAAIGFLNLLPVPVLDGGHLMFYAYEAVAGRRPSDRILDILSALGMAAVLSLMIFGLSNDLFCP